MTKLPAAKLYKFHVSNLNEIDEAMRRTALVVREAIGKGESFKVPSFTKLFALLLGAWAECRLQKLLHERNGFIEKERSVISKKSTQLDQWKETIKVAFRRQYRLRKANFSSLDHSARERLKLLLALLEDDLRPVIELRNKLAHGQWTYPLTNDGHGIAQEQAQALRTENLLSLQFKKQIIAVLSNAIHDLVVSKPTFERDFDVHDRHLRQIQINLKKRSYTTYENLIRQKYERGRSLRRTQGK